MALLRCAIVTISDRSFSGERPDLSGPELINRIESYGWQLIEKRLVPDEISEIKNAILPLVENDKIDIILTTGGTGCSPRDVTPEATRELIEKEIPGMAEAMRAESAKKNPHAMLSRGLCGISRNPLIINLPGSPTGAVENLALIAEILPHAVALIRSLPDAEAGHHFHH